MQKPEYIITSNLEKNRIYMKLKGFFQDSEVRTVAEKFQLELNKLKPGFDIINDISEFRPASSSGAEIIKETQKKVAQKGVRRLVRIVDNRVLGLLQFKTTAKEAGYDGINASNLEEAEKYLDSML